MSRSTDPRNFLTPEETQRLDSTVKEAEKQKDYFMRNCDEMWVFGALTNQVYQEIKVAKRLGKPVRYFAIANSGNISEISKEQVDISGIS